MSLSTQFGSGNRSGRRARQAVRRSVMVVLEGLERRRLLAANPIFNDDYSTDTTANYMKSDQAQPPTLVDSWKVANGTLNYSVQSTNGWNSSVFLAKPSVASTAGLYEFTTSGDITGGYDTANNENFQPGLVLSGDPTKGGFVVMEYDNGTLANHLVLLQETGGQLVGDEGGTGTPPVLADFGEVTNNITDTFTSRAPSTAPAPIP